MRDNYLFVLAFMGFWVVLMMVSAYQQGRRRHERHLERMAMIDKGMTPPLEPPQGVLSEIFEGVPGHDRPRSPNHVKIVSRNVGVILLCLGLGIGFLLLNTGADPRRTLGVGGLLVFLSAAFFVISWLEPTRPEPGAARPASASAAAAAAHASDRSHTDRP